MSATSSAPMIEVRDLTKNYGSFTALQGLTFQVPRPGGWFLAPMAPESPPP